MNLPPTAFFSRGACVLTAWPCFTSRLGSTGCPPAVRCWETTGLSLPAAGVLACALEHRQEKAILTLTAYTVCSSSCFWWACGTICSDMNSGSKPGLSQPVPIHLKLYLDTIPCPFFFSWQLGNLYSARLYRQLLVSRNTFGSVQYYFACPWWSREV